MTVSNQTPPRIFSTLQETLSSDGEMTAPLAAHGALAVHLTGAATTVDLRVQRHPAIGDGSLADGAGPVPAVTSAQWNDVGAKITAVPTVVRYAEPGVGWWRVKAIDIPAGDVVVALSAGI